MKNRQIVLGLSFLIIGIAIFVFSFNSKEVIWPKKISELNGWQGIEVQQGIRCPVCFNLKFPKEFGLNNEKEFSILLNLPRKKSHEELEYDLEGPLFVDRDVLDHLLRMAIESKDEKSAKVILNPNKYSLQIGLETSEDIEHTHVMPLLKKFSNLNKILPESDYEKLATNLIHWANYNNNFKDLNILIAQLEIRGYHKFVTVLHQKKKKQKISQ